MKALIIDEPWISLILSGAKTWEMRKGNCNIRGTIALIRKGSGMVVGTAQSLGSLRKIDSMESYAEAEPFHRISADKREQAFALGWRTPWVLKGVRPMARAVRYRHPNGAVIWVTLDPEIANQIDAQHGRVDS